MTTHDILVAAKSACADLASLSAEVKNNAILAMADSLVAHMEQILQANASDMEKAAGKDGNRDDSDSGVRSGGKTGSSVRRDH